MKKIIIRIFCVFVLIFVGLVLAQMLFPFAPQSVRQAKARRIKAAYDAKEMTTLLKQKAIEVGGVTNIENDFIFLGLSSGDFGWHTDEQGQILDPWQTSYQIKIFERTNFVVRSAGPNKIFGDTDDIIFNSVSNGFVKP